MWIPVLITVFAVIALATPSSATEVQDHMRSAQAALRSGDAKKADAEFAAVLALEPKNAEALANRGVIRYFGGDAKGAIQFLQPAYEANPSSAKIEALLGLCEEKAGNAAKSRKLLKNSLPRLENGRLRTQAGLALAEMEYASGSLDDAVDTVRLLEKSSGDDADVLYTAQRIYGELATQALKRMQELHPNSARLHQMKAEHFVNEGNVTAARAEYEKALAADPKLPGVHFELGEAMLHNSVSPDALQQAQAEFEAALKEGGDDARAEYWLGKVSILRLDFEGAAARYAKALQLAPGMADAELGLGDALVHLKRNNEALAHLQAAEKLDSDNATTHYRLATLYRELGRTAEAKSEMALFQKTSGK